MKFALVALFLVLAATNAQNAGVGIAVTQRVVNAFKDSFLHILINKIQSIAIPDFSHKGIEFKNIRITSPGITTQNTIANLQEGFIRFGVQNFNMVIQGDARIHFLFLKFHNGFIVTANGNSVSVDLVPTMSDSLRFKATNAVAHVGNVNIKITGFLGKLDTAIINLFHKSLTNTINQKLTQILQNEMVNNLQQISMGTPTQLPVAPERNREREPLVVNYTWVASPAVHTGYVSGGLNGTVYLRNNPKGAMPFTDTTVLPQVDTTTNAGLQIFFSQYVPQTVLYDLQVENMLHINITDSILPKNSTISMNTNSLNYLFPGLSKKFGNNQPCYMECYADNSTYPKAQFVNGGMGVAITSLCSLYAQYQTTHQWGLATTFKTTFNALGGVSLNSTSNALSFNVSSLSLSGTSIVVNNIGFLSGALLQTELNAVLMGFKAIFNTILSKESVPLPQIPNAVITEAKVTLKNGYAEVVCEPVFKSSGIRANVELFVEEDSFGASSDEEVFDA